MPKYLISFDDGAMNFPDEELPDVAEAAHRVAQEATGRGVGLRRRAQAPPGGERGGRRRDGHRWAVPR